MGGNVVTAGTSLVGAGGGEEKIEVESRLAREAARERPDLDWVRLDGRPFRMGSELRGRDSVPVHPVVVPSFDILRTEVTVAQYRVCAQAGKCGQPTPNSKQATCNWGLADRDGHPLNCVDWRQATAFCSWAGGRLPTEQEWEAEASNKGSREYPWGGERPECAERGKAELLEWSASDLRAQGLHLAGDLDATDRLLDGALAEVVGDDVRGR